MHLLHAPLPKMLRLYAPLRRRCGAQLHAAQPNVGKKTYNLPPP